MMRGTLVVAVACLVAFAGCSAERPAGESAAPPPHLVPSLGERPLDSLALIEQAVASGRIDYSTGLLYKVYVMFEPERVPSEYHSPVPAKCGTPLILEVQRNWDRLTPEQRSEIEVYVQPIKDPLEVDTQLDDVTRDRLDHEQEKID